MHDPIQTLEARIDRLTRRLDEQDGEIARLRGLAANTTAEEAAQGPAIASRRALLLAAGAAAAVFAPTGAHAYVRGRVIEEVSANFGIAGAPGAANPTNLLPALGATKHGVIGMADGKGMAPHGGAGVSGIGKAMVGVQGLSTNSYGVFGRSGNANAAGVFAYSSIAGGVALQAIADGTNGYAAVLAGTVTVDGDLAVTGNKSAVLPHPDGSLRYVYCVESPQAWLEDFGEAELVDGRAEVRLDPDFAALCEEGSCHIFMSEGGDHHLHVAQRKADGFSIEADLALAALKGNRPADLNGRFSYRIVGLRKDRPGARLAKFEPLKTKQQL